MSSKDKGGSVTAKTGIVRPFCSSPRPQKTSALLQSSLYDSPPMCQSRCAARLDKWSLPQSTDAVKSINIFFVSSSNFPFISNCTETGIFHNEPFYMYLDNNNKKITAKTYYFSPPPVGYLKLICQISSRSKGL